MCDTQQTAHSDELFAMRNYNTDVYYSKFVYDSVRTKNFEKCKQLLEYKQLSKSNEIDLLQANQHVFKKQKMSKITKQRPQY